MESLDNIKQHIFFGSEKSIKSKVVGTTKFRCKYRK